MDAVRVVVDGLGVVLVVVVAAELWWRWGLWFGGRLTRVCR